MKKKNLSAKKKIHNFYLKNLKNTKILKIYSKFKKILDKQNTKNMVAAISGGSDSMALAFLTKCYSIEKNCKFFYFIVDHRLRDDSTKEAKLTKKFLKYYGINCEILTWIRKKKNSNLQSIARENRYGLIFKKCFKKKIKLILTAHHESDLYENFFIRLLRGSGLKGLSSFNKIKSQIDKLHNINILRPLLDLSKKDLIYISNNTFKFFIDDPSNDNNYFLRIKLRKLIKKFNESGLNFEKLNLTLENLHKSNLAIEFFVKKNIENNAKFLKNKKLYILKENFFNNPDEIVFRSISELIHEMGNKKKYTRGNKIMNLMKYLNSSSNIKKMTLSGCILEKLNKSIIISREN